MKKLILTFLLLFSFNALAESVFLIVPATKTVFLRSDATTTIHYTITNLATKAVPALIITPNFQSQGKNLSIADNSCGSLNAGESCHFSLIIPGQNQPSHFSVTPRVCSFQGAICSKPASNNVLFVNVYPINHAARAYVGLSTNSVVPITLVNNQAGIPGSPISGLTLSEPAGIAIDPQGNHVYVTDSASNRVAVINESAQIISDYISVGNVPTAIAVNPNGNAVYVANFNDGQHDGTISVINTLNNSVVSTIAVGNGPWGLALTGDGKKLLVSNSDDNTVTIINTETNTVMGSPISVGRSPFGIAVAADGTQAYVANSLDGTVSVINPNTQQVINTITVGNFPRGVAITPDSNQVYVANWQDATVSVIDTHTNTVVNTIFLINPGPVGIAVSPDGTQVYVTMDASSNVIVINISNGAISSVTLDAPQITLGNFIG